MAVFDVRPRQAPEDEGGWLGMVLRWVADNPSAWPVPFLGFLMWRQDQLLWALVQRLDALTEAVRALERVAR